MIYADQRWVGTHGIGRFARHVLAAIPYHPLALTSNPAAPLEPWRLFRALRPLGPGDLFYSPGYNAPLFCRAPFLFTMHDLNHLDRPENSSPAKRLYYATLLKRAARRALCVVTVSEFSRRRILAWSGVGAEKVVQVGNGVGPEFHPEVEPCRLVRPYLLCPTSRKRHKNDLRVAEAFALAKLDDMLLVFLGEPSAELSACIERHRLSARVEFAGLVPEERLPALYRGAEAVVFASLYEGFGLPVLEAMACGTPVVTSTTTALPEVAGDAALLVNPASIDEIAGAMELVVHDSGLRQGLRTRGLTRATHFSWTETGARVRALLQSAVAEPAPEVA